MKSEIPTPVRTKTFYLPGLNGLRAIAALAVVVSHVTLSLASFGLNPALLGTDSEGKPKGLLLAGFGVSIFFALSGFLITYLLLLEKDHTEISLAKFYIRRILRIWPLYYLYLLVVLGVLWITGTTPATSTLPFYLFFLPNVPFILGNPMPYLAHYWSIGVEEQFYLFWPILVKKIQDRLLTYSIAVAGILITLKLLLHVALPGSIAETAIHVTRFQCMLVGAIGAILHKERRLSVLRLLDNKLTQAVAWCVMFLIAINRFHVASVLDNEFVSLVAVALIIGQINRRHALFSLENEFFDFLGKISYGIYVMHPLVILLCATCLGQTGLPTPTRYALAYGTVLAITIGLAYLSYRYVETPFLKLKSRVTVVHSSGTRHFNQKPE